MLQATCIVIMLIVCRARYRYGEIVGAKDCIQFKF
jgi:hypothetical protein